MGQENISVTGPYQYPSGRPFFPVHSNKTGKDGLFQRTKDLKIDPI